MPANFFQFRMSLGVRVPALLFCLLVIFSSSDKVSAEESPASIRVAIDDNYPPYIMRGKDNSLTGYLVDIWTLWETKTGVNVQIIAQNWDLAQQTMKSGGGLMLLIRCFVLLSVN